MKKKDLIGKYLYASCSAQIYGKILDVYKDDYYDFDVVDVQLYDHIDLGTPEDDEAEDYYHRKIIIPKNTNVVLKNAKYKLNDNYIEIDTPGSGCYRCSKYFKLMDYNECAYLLKNIPIELLDEKENK
jgi:hypothetical protein